MTVEREQGDRDRRGQAAANGAAHVARGAVRSAEAVLRETGRVPQRVYVGARRLGRELKRVATVPTFRGRSPVGAAPGTLISHPEAEPPTIRVMGYDADRLEEFDVSEPAEIRALRDRFEYLWIDVVGVGHAESVAAIGELFGLHRLALEDVVNVHQRPKVEHYPDHVFVVARMAFRHEAGPMDTEQVAIFFDRSYTLTFQEHPGDCFDPVRKRLREGRGRIRAAGPDYLTYALLDAVVDGYFPMLQDFAERLESLEEEILERPTDEVMGRVHVARRELMALRHAIWPMRDAVNTLYREPSALIDDEDRLYLRDCYDHTIQLIDLLETFREVASSLLDLYMSSVSNRMNEVMKVLTIIATIFIPLTFIAGIYGMNFDPDASPWNMPELGWYWGYPAALAVMGVLALGLVYFFRRKKWL